MLLFDTLRLSWDRSAVPAGRPASVDRAAFRFKQALSVFVFDAGALEGNPFTYPEVQTLLAGVTVGGHRLADQQQILGLAAAARELFALVRAGTFRADTATFDRLHGLIAREEALEWGHFRGKGEEVRATPNVSLGDKGTYTPPPTQRGAENLNALFAAGIEALEAHVADPRERAMAFFLFGALHQFYFDGNKRTSRYMMNGILMSNGMDAISVPAKRAAEFNEKMVRFFLTKDATEMMAFLLECQPKDACSSQLVSDV